MICVSIGRSRQRHVIAEHRHLVDQGAPLVELRLDYITGEVQVKKLLAGRPSPVIVTCRREPDGGKYSGTEDARQQLLRGAIAEGADYIDLEEDTAAVIPRFGNTKRIISHHDFLKTPDDLESLHARLADLDADIVKIATMANSARDNLRMLRLVQNSKIPTVGVCMGEMGTPSRILAGKFGSPFTFATFHHERTLAPGQLSFQEMREVYHFDSINADTEVFAVIADPVGHSMSPLVHNAALFDQGVNAVYLPFRVPREDLTAFLEEAPQLGIRGLSVTIPHKETVIRQLTKIDRAVQDVGAANTVVYGDDGSRTGFNTDCRAVLDSVASQIQGDSTSDSFLKGRTALVLGAGGVARAVAYTLTRRGAKVHVAGRTRDRAVKLAERFGCQAVDWMARFSVDCDILVNCTPVGMHPNVDETPFSKHHLKPSMVVFDTVYNPETTLLIKEARSQGCAIATGIEMFVRQASLQYRLFTGSPAPAELMRDVLRRAIGAANM